MDPEGEMVDWRKVPSDEEDAGSLDSAAFDLTTHGELSFKSPPNYEMPTDSVGDGRNTYIVQIEASDPEENTHTITVTVTVTNVNEPGIIAFSATQPKEETPLTATLMDPDGAPFAENSPPGFPINVDDLSDTAGPNGTTTWQWARCDTLDDNSTCTDIAATSTATTTVTSDEKTYTPSEDDRGKFLRVTAKYYDGADREQKNAPQFTQYIVLDKEYVNIPPAFPVHDDGTDGSQITLNVMENDDAEIGYEVGLPVQADDPGPGPNYGQEQLTYTLTGGSDVDSFDIDSSDGQILLGDDDDGNATSMDFEDSVVPSQGYVVQITATDPSGLSTTATVTIQVTDVDEAPVITQGDAAIVYDESTEGTSNTDDVETYNAADEDVADNALTWSLTGTDVDDLSISPNGVLTFDTPPDFEASTGGRFNNDETYRVTVVVADDAGNQDTRDVTVTVKNVGERGRIELTSHFQPEAGRSIQLALIDPDQVMTSSRVDWDWSVGDVATGTPSARQSSLTISLAKDALSGNEPLSVSATYADQFNTQKTNMAEFQPGTLVWEFEENDPDPVFDSNTSGEETIAEDHTGTVATIAATDSGGGLLYKLGGPGSDEDSFTINDTTGQISVAADAKFNYEATKNTYSLDITAEDPSGDSATHRLEIIITNVEEAPSITAGPEEKDYDENGKAVVAEYTAEDDEDDAASIDLVWSLDGVDDDLFTITDGELSFKSPPDFESPDDGDDNNVYNVIVQVDDSDVSADSPRATHTVVITVLDIEETGSVTYSARQPKEGTALMATLSDPDGLPDNTVTDINEHASTTWQWARCSSTSVRSCQDIEETETVTSTERTYTPSSADRTRRLAVRVMYRDGEGDNKTAPLSLTEFPVVEKEYVNTPPKFPDDDDEALGSQITLMVNENNDAEVGDPVGDAVAAEDEGRGGVQERLTYALTQGADQDEFTIDSSTGQLRLAAGTRLDFENSTDSGMNQVFDIIITATDPSGLTTTTAVTIEIINLNEAPSFEDGDDEFDYPENSDELGAPNTVAVDLYEATDEDADDNVTDIKWSWSGDDIDTFQLCLQFDQECDDPLMGRIVALRFKSSPDFEDPTDTGGDNEYNVVIEVTDGEATSTMAVVVTVEDVNEPGVVRFSSIQPEDGTPITASLTDPDVVVTSSLTWQWGYADANERGTVFTEIAGATSDTYTPTTPNAQDGTGGQYLRAFASYADGQGTQKKAFDITSNRVQPRDPANEPPEFPDVDPSHVVQKNQKRYISEFVEEGTQATLVVSNSDGAPYEGNALNPDLVVATDEEPATTTRRGTMDKLTYTLSESDSELFTIDTDANVTDQVVGQIRLVDGIKLDHEAKDSYTVMVRATDPSGAYDEITVTIEVANVDEAPTVQEVEQLRVRCDMTEESFEENQTGTVATCTASDPDGGTPTWSRSGPDSSVFSISPNGVLSIDRQLDYEPHNDANGDNVYEVTVTATTPDVSRSQDIEVTLVNVDEPGTVSISPGQPPYRVGDVLSASLDEGDDETVTSWQWARSTASGGSFTVIGGATNDTYTIVEADVDRLLQVIVTYDDPLGTGKSLPAQTTAAVLAASTAGTPGSLVLTPTTQLTLDDTVTATLTDADNPVASSYVWRWERSADGSTNWSSTGGTTASYGTVAADAGNYLRASVTYTDDSGAGQTADASTSDAVRLHRYDDNANGEIERNEVIAAINDYLFGTGTERTEREEVIAVINLYLFG